MIRNLSFAAFYLVYFGELLTINSPPLTVQDRPDLIQSELAGLAFDSLQQVFRKQDIANMYELEPLPLEHKQTVFLVVDPAAGGPSSDYAIVSLVRTRGNVQVILCIMVMVMGYDMM